MQGVCGVWIFIWAGAGAGLGSGFDLQLVFFVIVDILHIISKHNIPLPESLVVERSEPGKCPGVETPGFRRAFARLLFTRDSRIVFENFKANESTAKASVSSPGNIPGEVSPTSLTRENPGSLEATGYYFGSYCIKNTII